MGGDERGRGELGVGTGETVRKWVRQPEIDAGPEDGVRGVLGAQAATPGEPRAPNGRGDGLVRP
jgi:hypothetical protein